MLVHPQHVPCIYLLCVAVWMLHSQVRLVQCCNTLPLEVTAASDKGGSTFGTGYKGDKHSCSWVSIAAVLAKGRQLADQKGL